MVQIDRKQARRMVKALVDAGVFATRQDAIAFVVYHVKERVARELEVILQGRGR